LGVFASLLTAPAFAGPGALGAWTLLALIAATAGLSCGPLGVEDLAERRLPAWVFTAWRTARLTGGATPVLRLRSAEDEAELRRQARLRHGLVPQD
jgi:hypothetical protein